MSIRLGDPVSDDAVEPTEGSRQFHRRKRGRHDVSFAHSEDGTPVTTVSNGKAAKCAWAVKATTPYIAQIH